MGTERARRAARAALILVSLLTALAACSSDPRLSFCEGAGYAGQANARAAQAIDAASTGDAAAFAMKLEAARASLNLADQRLAEATSAGEPEGWHDWFAALRDALGETRSVLDALGKSPPPPTSLLRERLEAAEATLTTIGPMADCATFGAQASD